MSENETDWMESWNAFLGGGLFDQIDHPEDGYKIGDPVTDRSGIFALVKGFKGRNEVILALSREDDSKEKIVSKNDIRFNGDVMNALFAGGFVHIPEEKGIEITPPTDFDGKNSHLN